MKKKLIKMLVASMATTMLLSGCDASLKLNDKDEATEETSEELSKESADEASTEDSVDEEKESEDTEKEEEESEDTTEEEEETEDTAEENANLYECNADPGEWESPELMEGDALTQEELDDIQDFFSKVENYGFTSDPFKTVDDIDWGSVLHFEMAGLGYSRDCPEEAIDAFNDAREEVGLGRITAYDGYYEDLYFTTGDNFKAFVEAKTGMTDIDVSEMLKDYFYYEPDDVYLACADPFFNDDAITCEKGVRKENTIQVEISYGSSNYYNRRITLLETGDSDNPYQLVSCRQLWEKEAVEILIVDNTYSDETILCSVRYGEDNKYPSVQLMNDYYTGEKRDICAEDKEYPEVTDIIDVALCDLDNDGLSDLIVTAVCDGDTVPLIFKGYENIHESYGKTYSDFEYLSYKTDVTEWICDNVDSMTTDDVIDFVTENKKDFEEFYN